MSERPTGNYSDGRAVNCFQLCAASALIPVTAITKCRIVGADSERVHTCCDYDHG
jgi:hypothetical protein